jgi:PiT family inorganic phosphate transporter
VIGATAYALANTIGGTFGAVVDIILLAAVAGLIYWRSRKTKIDHTNVNQEWVGTVVTAEPEPAVAA